MAEGPPKDGLFFRAAPVTRGFNAIRERARCVNVQLILDDGTVGLGDCLSVIRSGSHDRHLPLAPDEAIEGLRTAVEPLLVGQDVAGFRRLADLVDGLGLHPGIAYGVSQAILGATAASQRRTMAQVIADEYGLEPASTPVPIFACAEWQHGTAVDQMIMGRAGALPHGGFTTVDFIGQNGARLVEYVEWLSARVQRFGGDDYRPIIHLDVYGTVGEICDGDVARVGAYLERLAAAARPLRVRVEDPIAATDAERSRDAMRQLTSHLDEGGQIEIVADEYCNTRDDIARWADERAAHMIHIKLPDLGAMTNAVDAALHCRAAGVATYIGGTMNDTEVSGRATVHLALAVGAAEVMAKPGACPDVSIAITGNEMSRTLALHASG